MIRSMLLHTSVTELYVECKNKSSMSFTKILTQPAIPTQDCYHGGNAVVY